MKKTLLALVAASFILSGCSGTTPITGADVVAWLKTNCSGIVAELADVTALIASQPAGTTVQFFGDEICNAVKAQQAAAGNAPTASAGGVVVVNGQPIHYSVAK